MSQKWIFFKYLNFRAHCVEEGCNSVFTPKRGEIIDATTERHIYQVFLLTFSVRFKKNLHFHFIFLS